MIRFQWLTVILDRFLWCHLICIAWVLSLFLGKHRCSDIQYNTIQYKICKAPCCRGFRGARIGYTGPDGPHWQFQSGYRAVWNTTVPIQLAQYRLPRLATFNAKIQIYFSNKIYESNFIKQHWETVMVWNYPNADCSLQNKFIVLFITIFGTLSFPIVTTVISTAP